MNKNMPPPANNTALEDDLKRTAILEVAREVFLERGYSFAGMAEIAVAASVSTATLYKAFGSKEELFIEVIRDLYTRIQVETESAMVETGLPMDEEMLVLIVSVGGVLVRYESTRLLRMVASEADYLPADARTIMREGAQHRFRLIARYLDRKIAEGLLIPHDTYLMARMFMGINREMFAWPEFMNPDFTLPETTLDRLREALHLYLAGYRADPSAYRLSAKKA